MEFQNLPHLLQFQAQNIGSKTALRHKRHGLYNDLSWSEYSHKALACAAALLDAGISPGDRVGIFAENSPQWLIADMGILNAAAVNVPPHAPLTASQVRYQLADAGVSWLFVSTLEQYQKIQQIRKDLPLLKGVVLFSAEKSSSEFFSWSGFLQRGRNLLPKLMPEILTHNQSLTSESLATIMYTSGTTGEPKGVMLTHGNLLSNTIAVSKISTLGSHSIVLSWLPFSHIYARTIDHYLHLLLGSVLCLAESAETVVENLAEIQPTNMACVPRFYEKLLSAVTAEDSAVTQKRLQAIFGPRIEWLSSGGAPLPPAIAYAYKDAGILVLQGYGLTESSPVISFNSPDRYKLESIGPPIPGVEVKIAVDGEILTRGPHVMPGYWNKPDETKQALQNGWLYTGDLGKLDDEGFLYITGRKKDLMILSNGKKIVPNHIEGLLLSDPFIDQVVIYGEGRNFLTALLVPNWENLKKELQLPKNQTPQQLFDAEELHRFLEKRIQVKLAEVSQAENVRKFIVLPEPFSIGKEELTVSLKLRRSIIFEKYRHELDALYQS